MEARSDEFPDADIANVIERIKQICLGETKDLRKLFEEKDAASTGIIAVEDAEQVLSRFVPKISKHAVKTVLRAFDQDGKFDYNPILKYIKG